MSGQLVGEVIAAATVLKARGISERGFMALIAIAEKCHTNTRQGSVRWDHIRDGLFGASKRTAQRAVSDLRAAGVLTLVQPGFNNNYGRSCAPVYAIQSLTDADTYVSQSVPSDNDKAVSQSVPSDNDKAVSQSGGPMTTPGDTDDDKTDTDDDTQVSYLTVLYDGPIDGTTKESGASATPATELVPDGGISAELFPPPQKAKTAKTRAAKTPFPEGWRPTSQQMAGFKAKYPALDIAWEFAAFENDAYAAGRFYANWLRAFAGWLHRGGSYRKPNNGHQPQSKVRTLAELAEKARRMEDLTRRAIEA